MNLWKLWIAGIAVTASARHRRYRGGAADGVPCQHERHGRGRGRASPDRRCSVDVRRLGDAARRARGRRVAAGSRARRPAHPDGAGSVASSTKSTRTRSCSWCARPAAARSGCRSIWPATVTPRSTSAAACRHGQARGGRSITDDGGVGSRLSDPPLGWSDDPGVFRVRNAVERARPQAGLVPALQRDLLAPSGPAPGSEWSSRPLRVAGLRPQCGTHATTVAARLSLDRGATGCGSAAAPRPPPARPDASLRGDSPVGACGALRGRRTAAGRAPPRTVDRDGAGDSDRDDGGARRRGPGARGALRAADRQSNGAVEPLGGGRSDVAGRRDQRHRDVHGGGQRGGVDELADRPPGGGIRASRSPRPPAVVGDCERAVWCRWSICAGRLSSSSSWPVSRTG